MVKVGSFRCTPDYVPAGSVICDECTREATPPSDMKTGTLIAWIVVCLLVGSAASVSWYYLHQLLHWFDS